MRLPVPNTVTPHVIHYFAEFRSFFFFTSSSVGLSVADLTLFLTVGFPAPRRACAVSGQKMIRYTGLMSYHLRAIIFVPISVLYSSAPRPNFFNPITYTGCFTTCGHYCRSWFPRSLWSKISYKLVSDFGRLRSYGHFLIPVHALLWTALWNQLAGDVLNFVVYRLRS